MTILIDHEVDKQQDAFNKLRLKLKDTDTPSVHRRIKMEMPTEELFKLVAGSKSLNDRPKSPNNVMLASTSKLLAKVANGERKVPDNLRLPSMQQVSSSTNARNRASLYNRQSSTGSRRRASSTKRETLENVDSTTPESPIDDSSSHEMPEQNTRNRNSSERGSRTASGACSPSPLISANELQRVTASPRRGSRSRSTERGSRTRRAQSQGPAGNSARRGRRSTSVTRSNLRAEVAQQTRLQAATRNALTVEMPRKESRGREARAPSANGRIDQSLREWVREHSASPRARAAQDAERSSSRGSRSRHGERSSARGARSMSCCRSERGMGERRARKSECLPPMAPQLAPNRASSDPTNSKTEGPLSGSHHSRNSRSKSTTKRASRRSMRGEHKVVEDSKSEREPSFHDGDDEIFAVVPLTRNFAGASKWKSLTKRSDLTSKKESKSDDFGDLNDLFQKSLEMDDWKPE